MEDFRFKVRHHLEALDTFPACSSTKTIEKESFMLTLQKDVSPLQHPQHLKDHPGGRYRHHDIQL